MAGLSAEAAAGPALDFTWSALPTPEASSLESVPESPQMLADIAHYEAMLAEGMDSKRRAAAAAVDRSAALVVTTARAELTGVVSEVVPAKVEVPTAAQKQAQRPRRSAGCPVGAVKLATPQTDAAEQPRASKPPVSLGVDVRKRCAVPEHGTVWKPPARCCGR